MSLKPIVKASGDIKLSLIPMDGRLWVKAEIGKRGRLFYDWADVGRHLNAERVLRLSAFHGLPLSQGHVIPSLTLPAIWPLGLVLHSPNLVAGMRFLLQ